MMMNRSVLKFLPRIRPKELGSLIAWLLRIRRIPAQADGVTLSVDPSTLFGARIIEHGTYESAVVGILRSTLCEGDVFVDLGANEGFFSMIASGLVGQKGRVFAIEPQERLWPVITQNIVLNDATNVVLVPFAVSDVPGEAEIVVTPASNSGAASLVANSSMLSRFRPKQKVLTRTLDELSGRYRFGEIGLLKIDIEGFELNALRSAEALLRSKAVRKMIIEIHPAHLAALQQSPEEVIRLLERHGYSVESRDGYCLCTLAM